MELQLIIVALLAALLLAGGLVSYIGRRDRGQGTASDGASNRTTDSASGPFIDQYRRTEAGHRNLQPEGGRPSASLPADPQPLPTPPIAPPPSPMAADATEDAPQAKQEDGVAAAARHALAANQAAMSDPHLSTLDRVQALMSSPAFALHLEGQAGGPPGNAPENDKRDPRGEREPLEPY